MISETFVQMSFLHYLSLVNLVLRYGLDSNYGEGGGGHPLVDPLSTQMWVDEEFHNLFITGWELS